MPSWIDEWNDGYRWRQGWRDEHPTLMSAWGRQGWRQGWRQGASKGEILMFESWHDGIARGHLTARSHEIVRAGLTAPYVIPWEGRITLSEAQNGPLWPLSVSVPWDRADADVLGDLQAYTSAAEQDYWAMIVRQYGKTSLARNLLRAITD